jgi:hypothetical protein
MLIQDIPTLFKQGKALTNPTTWANTTALTGVLAGFLVAAMHVAKALGYDFGVNDATLNQLAGGIAAGVLVVSNILHTLANPNAGLPTAGAPGPAAKPDGAGDSAIGPG